jgi:hypothetical protein
MNKISFLDACGIVYSKGLEEDHEREIAVSEFMPHKAFGGDCRKRAKAMSYSAERRVDTFRAYVFALSKEVKDGENTKDQQASLIAEMPEDDIILAEEGITLYGWWRN